VKTWHSFCAFCGSQTEISETITIMKYSLEVGGDTEKFLLQYEFRELWGSMIIKVDNREVKRSVRLFGGPKTEAYDLALGKNEMVNVRIERERRFLFGQRNRVFVNDRLVKLFEGV
jgi:hypothetical protein